MRYKFLKYSFIIFILILSSCTHSEYLLLDIKYSYDASWNSDSTKFAFVSIERLYRPATGIARFPDGGISKTEFERIAVYYYDIKNDKLTRVNTLTDFKFYGEINIRSLMIVINDTSIFYRLPKASARRISYAYDYANNKKDSLNALKIINNSKKAYQYSFKTKKIVELDTLSFARLDSLYPKPIKGNNAEDKYLKEISLTDLGIYLKDIYPQSKNMYKKYIVYGNGGKKIKDAIVEQELVSFSKEDILEIMKEMKAHKKELKEKSENTVDYKLDAANHFYQEYYKDMTKKLQDLLNKKNINENK